MPARSATVDPLAAQDAAEVRQQEVDDAHRGTRGEESLGIRKVVADQGHFVTGRLRSCIASRKWPQGRITSPPGDRARLLRRNIIRPKRPLGADRTCYGLARILRGASPRLCETMDPVEQAPIPGAVQNN